MKKTLAYFLLLIFLFYVLNPSAGIFELLPDNFPVVGNLDEVFASALILGILKYLGIDVLRFVRQGKIGNIAEKKGGEK